VTVVADHPLGTKVIETGQRVTFGRRGEVVLALPKGREDNNLPGVAFAVTAEAPGYTVEVPPNKREVHVYDLSPHSAGHQPEAVHGGDRVRFYWDRAEIVVHAWWVHRVVVDATRAQLAAPESCRGNTEEIYRIDLGRSGHRILTAMCRDRLRSPSYAPLGYLEALQVLGAAGWDEDAELNHSTARTRVRRVLPEIEGLISDPVRLDDADSDTHRRQAVVDWLVTRGVVTFAVYHQLVARLPA
jgi:hypothetical protein